MAQGFSHLLTAVSQLDSPSVHPAQYYTYVNKGSMESVLEWSPSSTPSASRRASRATADELDLHRGVLQLPETVCITENRLTDIQELTNLLQECDMGTMRPVAGTDLVPNMPFVGRKSIVAEFFSKAARSVHHVFTNSGDSRHDMGAMSLTGPAGSGKSRTLAELQKLLRETSSDSSIMQLPGASVLHQMMEQGLVCHLSVDFEEKEADIEEAIVKHDLNPNYCLGVVLMAVYLDKTIDWLLTTVKDKGLTIRPFHVYTVLGWVVQQHRATLADEQQRAPVLLLITADNSQTMPSAVKHPGFARLMFLRLAWYASKFGRKEDGAAVALMAAGTFIPALDKMLPTEISPARKALSPLTVLQATTAVAGALAKSRDWRKWARDFSALMQANTATSAEGEGKGAGQGEEEADAEAVAQALESQLRSTLALDYIAECGGRARYLSFLVDNLLSSVKLLKPYSHGALVAAVRHAFAKLHTEMMDWELWTISAGFGCEHTDLSNDVVLNIFYLAFSGIPVSLDQDMGSNYTLKDVAQAGTISLEPVLHGQGSRLFVVSLPRMILRSKAPPGFPTHNITSWEVGEQNGADWEKIVSSQLMLQCLALERFKGSQVPLRSVFAGAFGATSVLDMEVHLQNKYIETKLAQSQHLFPRNANHTERGTSIEVQHPVNQGKQILPVANYTKEVATQHIKHLRPWSQLAGSIISVDRYEGDSHPVVDLVVPFEKACSNSSGSGSGNNSSDSSSSGNSSSSGSSNNSLLVWVQVKKMLKTQLSVEQLQMWHLKVKTMTSMYSKHHQQVYAYVTTQKMQPQVLTLLEDLTYADLLVVARQTYEVFSPALRGCMDVEQVQSRESNLAKASTS